MRAFSSRATLNCLDCDPYPSADAVAVYCPGVRRTKTASPFSAVEPEYRMAPDSMRTAAPVIASPSAVRTPTVTV